MIFFKKNFTCDPQCAAVVHPHPLHPKYHWKDCAVVGGAADGGREMNGLHWKDAGEVALNFKCLAFS